MVEFITGQSGSGKTTLMFDRIKSCTGKQIIIVPEQFSYEFDKKLYFFLGAEKFNSLLSLTFTGLARQLFQIYGEPNRNGEYADDYARMIIVYQAISCAQSNPDMLNYFRRQSSYNGFAEEVLDLINDMKRSGITPQMLTEKSVFLDKRLMDKTNDIAGIYLEYDRLMREYGFKDNLENIIESAVIANRESFFKEMNVYIDEFESFNGDQLEMLKVMVSSAENVYITLRTDDVNAGEYTLFDTVNNTYRTIAGICEELHVDFRNVKCGKSLRFAGADLEYLSTHIMRNVRYSPDNAPTPDNIRIFEAKDIYSEVEYVCATIKHLLCDNPDLKYRDFAVISNKIEDYADVLRENFDRCGIPYFLSIAKPVMHTSVMVFFTSLLDLLTAKKLRSEYIFRFMKCGILDISLTDTALFENYCYKWNVDGNSWNEPFTAEDDNLELLENIRQSVINPLVSLKKKLSEKNTSADVCRMLYEYLAECSAETSIGRIMGQLIRLDRDYEAAELKRLWACLMDILDSVAATLGDKVISFSEMSRIIRSMIGKLEYSVPPQTLDSVTAASARTARLSAPKIVFAIGANDGDFPNQVSMHGIFSEADKQKLSQNGIEISRSLSDIIASERLVVYKALSSASEKLFITYPLSDLSGNSKYPAPVVDNIISMFGNDDILLTRDNIPLDYYAVTLHSAFYHYMQNVNDNNVYTSSIRKILMNEPDYRRRIEYVTRRSEHRQDFTVSTDVMKNLKSFEPLGLSATGIEEYSKCHFKYFCENFLNIRKREKIELDNRISGDMIHECFSGVLKNTDKQTFINMTPEELRERIEDCAEKYRKEKLAGDFCKGAGFEFMFRKLVEGLLIVFMHLQQEFMVTSFTPVAFEVEIEKKYSLVLEFGDGYKLRFGGKIDRADTCSIGDKKYLRIIDYKSSKKLINPENLAGGINLQMLLYLFSSTAENGIFNDCIPAGVLYSPIYPDDNQENINSALKSTGLVLGRRKVLDAMEYGIKGKFIPVTATKDGISKYSTCITYDGMEWLKDYIYGRLREMAESLLSGNVEAVPQCIGKSAPCDYCNYINICDNSMLTRYRTPDKKTVEEVREIMSQRLEKKEEN
ncbi:MAG: exodeoxyribonuclease V subunit gamma [Ruminococcus sp.]|nr:exodeoxyribonuclease V subunit gamma [Ruminococcus sp.]